MLNIPHRSMTASFFTNGSVDLASVLWFESNGIYVGLVK